MNLQLINKLKDYFKTRPIQRAWLFGSFSRNEENNESDIDIVVEFTVGERIGLLYFRIISELEDLCERKVDLAENNMLDSRIRTNFERDKVLIYERAS